ncbi:hypothetical protein T08_9799 [Trichinella sp. T8]|nr:hypothetical protein T08_9799 [Trichinella sp. T8]
MILSTFTANVQKIIKKREVSSSQKISSRLFFIAQLVCERFVKGQLVAQSLKTIRRVHKTYSGGSKFAISRDIRKTWEAYLCIEIGNVQN